MRRTILNWNKQMTVRIQKKILIKNSRASPLLRYFGFNGSIDKVHVPSYKVQNNLSFEN